MDQQTKSAEKTKKRYAIDLFAGGGGLSVGLSNAGFHVCAAVEIDAVAANTYARNHKNTVLFQSDIRNISGKELIRTSPENRIDLISACPPCQGFSSLTAKYKRVDPRNELIFQFVRIVEEIKPLAIMMENVPGLALKGKSLFDAAMNDLERMGYKINFTVADVANYGVPQHRRRLVVLGALGKEIEIPKPTHAEFPTGNLHAWNTVKDAIWQSVQPITLKVAQTRGGPKIYGWNVVRNLSFENVERLRAIKAGAPRSEMPLWLRPKCHMDSDNGFSNVYGRMSWNKPSPTITGGCTTLSKGRFGHPSRLRTISVREAAALQTFPNDYTIDTDHIDQACKIIGNALPPIFAEKMASACKQALEDEV